jgi:hypothetical protein
MFVKLLSLLFSNIFVSFGVLLCNWHQNTV